jgi:hypothetical protein
MKPLSSTLKSFHHYKEDLITKIIGRVNSIYICKIFLYDFILVYPCTVFSQRFSIHFKIYNIKR